MLRAAVRIVHHVRGTAAPLSTLPIRDSYGLFIGGEFVRAQDGAEFEVLNPATAQPLTRVASAGEHDVDRAVAAARDAFDQGAWSRASVRERAAVLNRAAALLAARVPDFAAKEVQQTGRPIREMSAQLGRLPEWLEYFAAVVRVHEGTVPPFPGPYINYVRRVPLGVVGQITPWNHPMLIAIKKIAPALAAGNSVVVKPSELAPVTLLDFAALCAEAGLPPGVLNIVPGLGPVAGKALSSHRDLKKLDLTGGTETGRHVAAAAGHNLASVVAELGGKAPVLVFEDADVEAAVSGALFGAFIASGQTCVMGSRLIVHESLFERVRDRFAARARSIRVGDPTHPDTQMGPVISARQLERVQSFVEGARRDGARVVCGGAAPELPAPLRRGFFYQPTVIDCVHPSMHVVQEEVFGPVVVVYSFKDEDDAVRLANDSPYGLAAAVWTRDVKRAHRVADRLDVGLVWVNDHHRNDPSSPWGGMKDSGMGRENGLEAFHEYTQSKSVVVSTSDAPFDWYAQTAARYG